jgi:tricorn protease
MLTTLLALIVTAAPGAGPSATPDASMLRYPDIGKTDIVFAFQGNLWLVPKEGGTARPLTTTTGEKSGPRFSPDGSKIAFVASYDGNRDIYVMPAAGGLPLRVTHHPTEETVSEWTTDGSLVFSADGMGLSRTDRLYRVKETGGLPEALPVAYGANGTISADGEWLAYTPHSIDNRTWKRYRGGMQTDIWVYNLKTGEARRATDHEGVDSLPMWQGSTLYYLSDDTADKNAPHKLNIWSWELKSGARKQVTRFTDEDVKWPAIGDGEIVFQKGTTLMVLDLGSGASRAVEVKIPGDRPAVRTRTEDVSDQLQGSSISPSAKRVAVAARGDIWSAPAENGVPRNMTRTDGIAERNPAWSPDGKWIAYFDDSTGEYELWAMPADGKGAKKQLTKDGGPFKTAIQWLPDSKKLAYQDKTGTAYVVDFETGERKTMDKEPWDGGFGLSFSHNGAYIAYAKSLPDRRSGSIWIYDVAKGESREVTSGEFEDGSPTFDRAGDWLYFTSKRGFSKAEYSEIDQSWIYQGTMRGYAVPLRTDVKNPWALEIDEENGKDAKKDEEKKDEPKKDEPKKDEPTPGAAAQQEKATAPAAADAKKDDKKEEPKPFTIDYEDFEGRAIELPLGTEPIGGMAVNDKGQLIFAQGGQVKLFDFQDKKKEVKKVTDGMEFQLTADGSKMLAGINILDATAGATGKPIVTKPMLTEIDPKHEWKQVTKDAWRIFRDYFYDPHMHGVDWPAVGQRYLAMVDDANSRYDVSYIISQMISELNVGHAYYSPSDRDSGVGGPSINVGMLGVDWSSGIDPDGKNVYRFRHIVQGALWDVDARNPLKALGVGVKEGEYLLAVNGLPVDGSKDPWAAFQGLAGKTISLTVGPNPSMDDKVREVVVKPMDGEDNIRYRDWIEANRRYVAEKSGGKVGYIYVPNTGIDGQSDLVRQFQGEQFRQGMIIDERWNGGGQIPNRFIELLNRPITNYWARRDQHDWVWPPVAHRGPKAMLINGLAGSGGDMLPWLFRQQRIGPLVGTRTWGGLVGLNSNPGMIDGSSVSVPTFAFYETDGTWGIEGHGVDPDVEVLDDPGVMKGGPHNGGIDPQLDKAIELVMAELARNPIKPPPRPAYPNRAGFGIKPEDK